jgi:DNA-binding CsgD family transcriptional regulator
MKTETTTLLNGHKQDSVAPQHRATGVVLFSSSGQLLFMNNEAQIYIRQLQPPTTRENGTCLIPEDIHAVVRELISRLMSCDHPKDCETIQVERLCFAADQRMLLRGLCIPDIPLARNSRLLIVMEKLNQKLECPDANIQQRYHLTEREQMVIIYLMLGFTNKEIANRLNLSEYTVKEHLKRIMQKTKTTTRTGLLARMIFPTPQVVFSEVLSGSTKIEGALGTATLQPIDAIG